jgi:hypothetical protein
MASKYSILWLGLGLGSGFWFSVKVRVRVSYGIEIFHTLVGISVRFIIRVRVRD